MAVIWTSDYDNRLALVRAIHHVFPISMREAMDVSKAIQIKCSDEHEEAFERTYQRFNTEVISARPASQYAGRNIVSL